MLCSFPAVLSDPHRHCQPRGTSSEVQLSTRDQSRSRYGCQRVWHNHGRYGERNKAKPSANHNCLLQSWG